MKPKIVSVPTIIQPIQPSPGFKKKELADNKLDLLGLCQFGCWYCSTNSGYTHRINGERYADATEAQLGIRLYAGDDPALMMTWPEIIRRLAEQLERCPQTWGAGKTLVFSMLTDGFSPELVKDGTTEAALRLVLDRTSFRIRVLTKNAIVGSARWIKFFLAHRDRFVVGLSCGTTDDAWAKRIEIGTSPPTARLNALRRLQEAGIATYGMLCPVFPHALEDIEELIEMIRPSKVEHIWAEPFNDRKNWSKVREQLPEEHMDSAWLTTAFAERNRAAWSGYATELYRRLRKKALQEKWVHKLRYLLYESDIVESDAHTFKGLKGVLLQGKPDGDGLSQNEFIAAHQSGRVQNDRAAM